MAWIESRDQRSSSRLNTIERNWMTAEEVTWGVKAISGHLVKSQQNDILLELCQRAPHFLYVSPMLHLEGVQARVGTTADLSYVWHVMHDLMAVSTWVSIQYSSLSLCLVLTMPWCVSWANAMNCTRKVSDTKNSVCASYHAIILKRKFMLDFVVW